MSRARLAGTLALACMSFLLLGCPTKESADPTDSSRPYVGTWRMPTSGATWVFNEDGTCSVNGQAGTYTESNGTIVITGEKGYTVGWRLSDDGKQLTITHTSRSNGRSFGAEFERQ